MKALGLDVGERRIGLAAGDSSSGLAVPAGVIVRKGGEADFAAVNYSGSHDKTWKLVETGSFEAGAMNAVVWQKRVDDGSVDTNKVEAFYTTPAYFDYHWLANSNLDQEFGSGTTEDIHKALLDLNAADGGIEQEIMEAFDSLKFILTQNDNYNAIEQVARDLGIIEN